LQLKEYIDDTEDLINIKLVGVNMNFNFMMLFFSYFFIEKKKKHTRYNFSLIFTGKCSEPTDSIRVASYCSYLCGYNICCCDRNIWDELCSLNF